MITGAGARSRFVRTPCRPVCNLSSRGSVSACSGRLGGSQPPLTLVCRAVASRAPQAFSATAAMEGAWCVRFLAVGVGSAVPGAHLPPATPVLLAPPRDTRSSLWLPPCSSWDDLCRPHTSIDSSRPGLSHPRSPSSTLLFSPPPILPALLQVPRHGPEPLLQRAAGERPPHSHTLFRRGDSASRAAVPGLPEVAPHRVVACDLHAHACARQVLDCAWDYGPNGCGAYAPGRLGAPRHRSIKRR